MKYVEMIADASSVEKISKISKELKVADFRTSTPGDDGMQSVRMLVGDDKIQSVLDGLQNILTSQPSARLIVMPIEISLPKLSDVERKEEDAAIKARESLYNEVEKNTQLDLNFIALILLSTAVGTVGLIENNVTFIIGAMVIAPLLGPNLAFGMGTALGDTSLMRKSAISASSGLILAIALSFFIGLFWQSGTLNEELASRTVVGIDSIVLALASGAAAALSLTTGLSSILVGVMVAVALLPPASTLGIMLAQGNTSLATGAALLLAVNIVCVNLSSKIVFFIKGIRPRTWLEKKKAKHEMLIFVLGWVISLAILIFIIYSRGSLTL